MKGEGGRGRFILRNPRQREGKGGERRETNVSDNVGWLAVRKFVAWKGCSGDVLDENGVTKRWKKVFEEWMGLKRLLNWIIA